MARSGGGPGGCLISILVILVFLAVFGLVDWGTVIGYAEVMVLLFVSMAIVVVLFFGFSWLTAGGD
jgi:hypothetical protein